jgi:outer membrane protein OmpA-like peptidoglycan-associated protein
MVMKKLFLGVFAVLALGSCSGDFSGFNLGNLVPSSTVKGFYGNLSNEYKNLASYAKEHMGDEGSAAHFEAKARKALRSQDVKPDSPDMREIPAFAQNEISSAYEMLADALTYLNEPQNSALLAMAQTRYDCWLFHQERLSENDYIACKTGFYDALALLDVPERDKKIYAVYFESGSTSISDTAKATLEEVAERYAGRSYWSLVLKGFSDTSGDRRSNRTLSMRRAVAVKNTLGQYGLDLGNIAVSAEGESGPDESEETARRVEIRAWPQYVAKNKEGLALAPGWSHSLSQ